jgi:hypothetical protein
MSPRGSNGTNGNAYHISIWVKVTQVSDVAHVSLVIVIIYNRFSYNHGTKETNHATMKHFENHDEKDLHVAHRLQCHMRGMWSVSRGERDF